MSAKPIGYLYFRSCIFCNSQSKTMRYHQTTHPLLTATIIASVTTTTATTATTTATTNITTMISNPAATTTMVFISDFENRLCNNTNKFPLRTLDPPLSLNNYDWKVENYTAKMKHSSLYITNKKKWSIKVCVDKKYLKIEERKHLFLLLLMFDQNTKTLGKFRKLIIW